MSTYIVLVCAVLRQAFVSVSSGAVDYLHDCVFDSTGALLAVCGSDQRVRVFHRSSATGRFELEWEFRGHSGSVLRVSFCAPQFGCLLASCSSDRMCHVYQRAQSGGWKKRAKLIDARGAITGVQFAPPHLGLLLATCATDGKLRVYECADWQNLTEWTTVHEIDVSGSGDTHGHGHGPSECTAVAWNPSPFDAASVCVAAMNGTVRVYSLSLSSGKWVPVCELVGHTDAVLDVSWSPVCGRSFHRIATACKDGAVRIFELVCAQSVADAQAAWTVRLADTLTSHRAPVWRVQWNLTGSLLASSGDDGKTRLNKQDFNGKFHTILTANTKG